ncbi:MAG: hypothetical protein HYZ81_26475 [Nitrospinae bacterium]|nr:hypothetical protein [Nitrospinota bacterium]
MSKILLCTLLPADIHHFHGDFALHQETLEVKVVIPALGYKAEAINRGFIDDGHPQSKRPVSLAARAMGEGNGKQREDDTLRRLAKRRRFPARLMKRLQGG